MTQPLEDRKGEPGRVGDQKLGGIDSQNKAFFDFLKVFLTFFHFLFILVL